MATPAPSDVGWAGLNEVMIWLLNGLNTLRQDFLVNFDCQTLTGLVSDTHLHDISSSRLLINAA